MPHPRGIGSCYKSETGNNQGRKLTTPLDNRWFKRKDSHSNKNEFSSPVISVSPPLNNSVINPPQLSLVRQQSSSSSYNTPRDNWWFNTKDSNSKSNGLSSPVITVPPPFNYPLINPPQMSLVCQQSSSSLHNTTHELQASSIPGRNSPDPSNTCHRCPPRTKVTIFMDAWLPCLSWHQNNDNIMPYCYFSIITSCVTKNEPSSMFVSPPHIPNIEPLSHPTYHHLIVDHLVETKPTWIFKNKLHRKYPIQR